MSDMQTDQERIEHNEPTDINEVLNHEQESDNPDVTPQEETPKEPSSADRNFARLREEKARAEQENAEMKRRLAALEAKMKDPEPADDDYAEHKDIKAIKREFESLKAEQRLRSQYPDIDSVINAQAIAALNEHEPEIARSIASTPNEYDKAVAAYKAIKRFGIYRPDTHTQEKSAVHANANKPKPAASLAPQEGDSPLHRANAFSNGLTEELKAQLWKEMKEAMGNKI